MCFVRFVVCSVCLPLPCPVRPLLGARVARAVAVGVSAVGVGVAVVAVGVAVGEGGGGCVGRGGMVLLRSAGCSAVLAACVAGGRGGGRGATGCWLLWLCLGGCRVDL